MAIFMCVGYFYFHIYEMLRWVFAFPCTWLHFARFHLWGGLNFIFFLHILWNIFNHLKVEILPLDLM
jgi:hypothetical protein